MGRRGKSAPQSQTRNPDKHVKHATKKDCESCETGEERPWGSDIGVSCIGGVALLALYIRTLHPSIPGGDSGELIVSAHEFGVAHPPGYPVFTLTAKAAMMWFPWGTPAARVNLLNAIYSAVAGALLQLSVLRLTGCHGSSFFAVGLFSLSGLCWTWSVTAEVFGLNNLMVAAIVLLAVIFDRTTDPAKLCKVAYLGAFMCGLSLCNQHTVAVYVICIALWVLWHLHKVAVLRISTLMKLAACCTIGLLPYMYLPLASWLNIARWTWGDQTTLSGFVTHLLRREYGTFDLGKGESGLGFTEGVRAYVDHALNDLCYVGPILALFGAATTIYRFCKGTGGAPFAFFLMALLYASLFAWRANLNIANPLLKGVVTRFWIQTDFVVALLSALGLDCLLRWLTRKLFGEKGHQVQYIAALICAVIVTRLQVKWNFSSCDQSDNFVVRDFAMMMLNKIPHNSLVLTKGDLPTNSMRYLHLCEKVRPDLQLLDQEVLTYHWSLPMLQKFYTKINFPGNFWHVQNAVWSDGSQSFDFRTFLDVNYKRFSGIFACIGVQEHDSSWTKGYNVWPYGPCKKLIAGGTQMNPVQWADITGSFADGWPHAHDAFEATSWEKVANDEMWHAKIGAAFFLYQHGTQQTEPTAQTQLFHTSYLLYKKAIEQHRAVGFPVFWHKNFALVCEKLLHLEHSLSKVTLCSQSIEHFRSYSQLAPEDSDMPNILSAIDVLKQRLAMYKTLEEVKAIRDLDT